MVVMKDNEDNKMTEDKFILMGLNDERAGNIAEVLKNPTCKKILDFLGEVKEASEKDISSGLGIPINTAEYNLEKLVKSGLVEKAKNFFWSTKGKKILMYKLARKHIIISPSKQPSVHALKAILPVIIIVMAALAIILFVFPQLEKGSVLPVLIEKNISEESSLNHFANYNELKDFLKENYGEDYSVKAFGEVGREAAPMTTAQAESAGSADTSASEFSTTNIQVEGVDEADIVKNDGKYIYAVSGNKVAIVNAYPAENMKILSEIDVNKSVSEIFVNEDKLIVFASDNEYIPYREGCAVGESGYSRACGGYSKQKSLVYIYDVSDRENPELKNTIETDGNYVDSRMIKEHVYVISTKYINIDEPEPPVFITNGVETKVKAEEVYYWPYPDNNYVFTSITAINLEDGETNSKVYLTGYTGTIYVSQDNIYLTQQKWMSYEEKTKRMIEEVYLPLLPDEYSEQINDLMDSSEYTYSKMDKIKKLVEEYLKTLEGEEFSDFSEELGKKLADFEVKIEKEQEKTIIHKINVNKDKIEYKGQGEAPGHILNQFSMDEYQGNFRIAATTGNWRETSLNHLYILDKDLKIIGKVEDLAKGERIYSVRFLGARAYVVTFKQIDPLFVIDVENPKKPEVLGYLKITGVSDYLHFYDENHIIGIGKEATEQGRFLGLKISLFDVSDVENPIEKAKIEIGDRGTDSLALQEHKAFLFDKQKNLLVIPISLAEIKDKTENMPPTTYGERVWEGAYVLNINTEEISVRGKITHVEEYKPRYGPAEDEPIGATREANDKYYVWTKISENKWQIVNTNNSQSYYYYKWEWTDETIDAQEGGVNYKQYMYDWKFQIKRSLYMDNVLYTISQAKIKANNLETIDEISKVSLPYEGYDYPTWGLA